MKRNEKNGVVYYTFDSFTKLGLRHGYTTRLGGVSAGPCESLNLAYTAGDAPDNVRENIRRAGAALGFDPADVVASNQSHTTNIIRANLGDRGKGCSRPVDYSGVDGLTTDERGIVLMTYYADCVPLFFYDREKRVAALSHSGWRGTADAMAIATLSFMARHYGSRPEHLICGIGPCIQKCCFETDGGVAEEFAAKLAFAGEFTEKRQDKYFIDLTGINTRLLTDNGVLPENIETAERLCTCHMADEFFSHRRSGLDRGSMAAFLAL